LPNFLADREGFDPEYLADLVRRSQDVDQPFHQEVRRKVTFRESGVECVTDE